MEDKQFCETMNDVRKKKSNVIMPLVLLLFGIILGILSKVLDIHTSNLGNIFSQMSVWILLGTLIAIFSKTKCMAAINVSVFCIGMLISYYITAERTNSAYGMTFIYGWATFVACSPVFAALTWMTKEKGAVGKIISFGILLVTLTVSMVVYDGPRVYDVVIILILVYFLLLHKVKR